MEFPKLLVMNQTPKKHYMLAPAYLKRIYHFYPIMNLERKLQILRNCDFSSWRKWKIEGNKQESLVMGFGFAIRYIQNLADDIVDGLSHEDAINNMHQCYGIVMSDYATVPFEEIDRSDEDFRFLFEYRDGLTKLGRRINVFVNQCRKLEFSVNNEMQEYADLVSQVENLKQRDYRTSVLRKYELVWSEPVPSP